MSQDQIAKLMAISGRLPATAPVEPTLGGMDDGVRQPSAPPPLLDSEAIQLSAGATAKPAAPDEPPTRRVARRRPAGPVRGKIAANDDVPSIGGLIYALEQKPSTKVFRIATVGSIIWAVVGLAFGKNRCEMVTAK